MISLPRVLVKRCSSSAAVLAFGNERSSLGAEHQILDLVVWLSRALVPLQ